MGDHEVISSTSRGSTSLPQLAFGLYKVPNDAEGERIVLSAISAGYRHFDGGEFYQNEEALGRAMERSGIPRNEFCITGKVWKDTMSAGPKAIRESVDRSLEKLGFRGVHAYFDLLLLHWPVPGHFIQAYGTLQEIYAEGKTKALGLSNFTEQEYEELMSSGVVTVPPICNQIEISPMMYRPDRINYFRQRKMVVVAFKPLNRGGILTKEPFVGMATKYNVTVPQLLLRWAVQHGFVVICKSSSPQRMAENRSLWHFSISSSDMNALDHLTTPEDILARTERENVSKQV